MCYVRIFSLDESFVRSVESILHVYTYKKKKVDSRINVSLQIRIIIRRKINLSYKIKLRKSTTAIYIYCLDKKWRIGHNNNIEFKSTYFLERKHKKFYLYTVINCLVNSGSCDEYVNNFLFFVFFAREDLEFG